jgi:hypothetical protein
MYTKCWSGNAHRNRPPFEKLGQRKNNNIKKDFHEEVNCMYCAGSGQEAVSHWGSYVTV